MVKRVKIPKAGSKLEATFMLHLMAAKLPEMPEREYKFHPDRKWKFDFCFVRQKLAVEIEGGIYGGRHTRPQGFQNDCEKYNTALVMGWRVLRFTASQIGSMEAIRTTREALQA